MLEIAKIAETAKEVPQNPQEKLNPKFFETTEKQEIGKLNPKFMDYVPKNIEYTELGREAMGSELDRFGRVIGELKSTNNDLSDANSSIMKIQNQLADNFTRNEINNTKELNEIFLELIETSDKLSYIEHKDYINLNDLEDIKNRIDIISNAHLDDLEDAYRDLYGDTENSVEDNAENESEYPSSYEERIKETPREGERGHWEGERGESKYIPTDSDIIDILKEYGLDGIEYKNGIPDFSKVSESTVEIDNMTDNRNTGKDSNFAQCDKKAAEQWNEQQRDGRTDWTGDDVKKWREDNNYSWHERNDMKTCDLVPTDVNLYFGHIGGVGEYKKSNREEGFDE